MHIENQTTSNLLTIEIINPERDVRQSMPQQICIASEQTNAQLTISSYRRCLSDVIVRVRHNFFRHGWCDETILSNPSAKLHDKTRIIECLGRIHVML